MGRWSEKRNIMGAKIQIILPKKSNEQGFTLAELLIAASLSGILFGIIFQLIHISEIGFDRGWHKSDFYRSTQKALLLISSEIRGASAVSLVNSRTLQLKKNQKTIRYKIQTDTESQQIIRQIYNSGQKKWVNHPVYSIAVCQKNSSNGELEFALKKIASNYYRVALKNRSDGLFVTCFLRGDKK